MKKVVMILSVTMISLTAIEASEHTHTQSNEEQEIKKFLGVMLGTVSDSAHELGIPDHPDGAEEVPKIPIHFRKNRKGRVKSMELPNGVSLVRSKRSVHDLMQDFKINHNEDSGGQSK